MITICFTYFRSLQLAHFIASLKSVSRQDLSHVEKIIVLDNGTQTAHDELLDVIDDLNFSVPVELHQCDPEPSHTHAWSTNRVVAEVRTPWIFFTRADYVLHPECLYELGRSTKWNEFGTSYFRHLSVGVEAVGESGLELLPGIEERYGEIDAGVWLLRKAYFDQVGGLDESLTAWGHAQTHFQYKLYRAGVQFNIIPRALFFHPIHGAERDINVAHQQLGELGFTARDLWDRYTGPNPY